MKKMIKCTLVQNKLPVLINPNAIACVMKAKDGVNITRIVMMAQVGEKDAPLLIDVSEPFEQVEKMLNRRGFFG